MKSSNAHKYLLIAYTLSGVAGISFEVLWAKFLANIFGISIFGVVITVAGFMIGLGIGSILGAKYKAYIKRPLIVYALLECSLVVLSLLMPQLIETISAWMTAASQGMSINAWYLLQFSVILPVMVLPAVVLGAAFPMILQGARQRADETRVSAGRLYGINAIGGMMGAMLPLLLLPAFGWYQAIYITASLAAMAAILAFYVESTASRHIYSDDETNNKIITPSLAVLFCYGLVGAASLMLEVAWTRLYGMIFLRTEYVLAIILATFLGGIGLGSLLSKYMKHPNWMSVFPIMAASGALLSLWLLPLASAMIEATHFNSLLSAMFVSGMVVLLLTLPVTLVMGAWLPLIAQQLDDKSLAVAWLYGSNAIGAGLGVILAGFVFIPFLGTTETIVLATLLMFSAGMYWSNKRSAWLMFLVVLGFAWPVLNMPAVSQLLPQAQAKSVDVMTYEDAVSITHVIERPNGQRLLISDMQRMDASTDPTSVFLQKNQARLAMLLKPDASNVLFMGMGTGITASGALPFLDANGLDVVELSHGAILAAETMFDSLNDDISRQANIYRDDVRRYLMLTENHYDVIVGDVFHPDMVGRSVLLSKQQFERVKARLADEGVFVQWLALNQFDVETLKIVMRTFSTVFSNASIFVDGYRLALVGVKDGSLDIQAIIAAMTHVDEQAKHAMMGGEDIYSWLGRYWGEIDTDAGIIEQEMTPYIEYAIPYSRYNGKVDIEKVVRWLVSIRPDPKSDTGRAVLANQLTDAQYALFERSYISMGLTIQSWLATLNNRPSEAARLIRFANRADAENRWAKIGLADSMLNSLDQAVKSGLTEKQALRLILDIYPTHIESLRRLYELEKDEGNHDVANLEYLAKIKQLDPLASWHQELGQ